MAMGEGMRLGEEECRELAMELSDEVQLLRQHHDEQNGIRSPKIGIDSSKLGEHFTNLDGAENEGDTSKVFVIILTLAAGIGGFLFGYDTGANVEGKILKRKSLLVSKLKKNPFVSYLVLFFTSGKTLILWIRVQFCRVIIHGQETIVSTAIGGAALGAALGGKTCDRFGRKTSMLIADVVFLVGSMLMALASTPSVLIGGRVMVGLGIGIASMAAPLYIAETSPSDIRGALVSVNTLMVTTGQLVSYLINYAFTQVPGTWRWMLGIAGLPALFQVLVFMCLPESPRWLVRKGKVEAAISVFKKIYPPEILKTELQEVMAGAEAESEPDGVSKDISIGDILATKEMRLALIAGVGFQIFQQLVGINTVMYYSPSIMELAGFASHRTALLLSLLIAGMNALGTVAGILLIDRSGRRKLALSSLIGVTAALFLLSVGFHMTTRESPNVIREDLFDADLSCSALLIGQKTSTSMTCLDCLQAGCGFCAAGQNEMQPGSCLVHNGTVAGICTNSSRSWFTQACPSQYGWLVLVGLVSYILAFSPGMGPVPWAVNSEIYPSQLRGVCGGIAATANWISNLVVAQSFLSLTHLLGTAGTFFLFTCMSVLATIFVLVAVPETKGLSFEEVEKLWEERAMSSSTNGWFPWTNRDLQYSKANGKSIPMQIVCNSDSGQASV